MKPKIYLIAAVCETTKGKKRGIGFKNKLPWPRLKEDMAFFKKITTKTDDCQKRNMVIMGRKTWESLPEKHRPMSGRRNIVLTNKKDYKVKGAVVCHDFNEAVKAVDDEDRVERIFVIGGADVYEQAIRMRSVKGIYLTRIKKKFDCDVFFPTFQSFTKVTKMGEGQQDGIEYDFLLLERKIGGRR